MKVTQSCLKSATPWTIQSLEFSRPEYWSGEPFPSPWDLPNPGIELGSPALQADSFPAEPQGKPKNTGAGILSLLQCIFPTQELNQGLLHCRWILYQLNFRMNGVAGKSAEPGLKMRTGEAGKQTNSGESCPTQVETLPARWTLS